jgi:peptide-methionine (R)-S-oxide reductase
MSHSPDRLTRRALLLGALSAAAVTLTRRLPAAPGPSAGALVTIEEFAPSGKSLGPRSVPVVVKTDAEWRAQLTPLAYDVTRHEGTERAYSGAYESNHADGLYACICCGTVLFDSRTKFDSGTGWPSFWQPISKLNVVDRSDDSLGMQRTAVSCRRCNAHLGHVFDDGPPPTGLRYCMNSVSLNFSRRA